MSTFKRTEFKFTKSCSYKDWLEFGTHTLTYTHTQTN